METEEVLNYLTLIMAKTKNAKEFAALHFAREMIMKYSKIEKIVLDEDDDNEEDEEEKETLE